MECIIHCKLNLHTLFCDILLQDFCIEIQRAHATSISEKSHLFIVASDTGNKQNNSYFAGAIILVSTEPSPGSLICFLL